MRKFKLLALSLVIGTGSLFATSNAVLSEPELDAEFELEEILEEAYGDLEFYNKLQKENQEHLEDINYWSKNLNAATILDDNHGLVAFEILLKENYEKYIENDDYLSENSTNNESSHHRNKVNIDIEVKNEKKTCSSIVKF